MENRERQRNPLSTLRTDPVSTPIASRSSLPLCSLSTSTFSLSPHPPPKNKKQLFVLHLRATLENVESLKLPNGYEFCVDVKESAGEERRERVTLSAAEELELPGSRGVAHLVVRFDRGSKHAANASVVMPVKGVTGPDGGVVTASDEWQPVAGLECRGLEPTGFHPGSGFEAVCASGARFGDLDLSEGEWCDFDEKGKVSVGVYGLEGKWEVSR